MLDQEHQRLAGLLKEMDIGISVDDSGSMGWEVDGGPKGWRYEQATFAAIAIAEIAATQDDDGIELYFFNTNSGAKGNEEKGFARGGYYNLRTADQVRDNFPAGPSGGTPALKHLDEILRAKVTAYQKARAAKKAPPPPYIHIIITDGASTDTLTYKSYGDVIAKWARVLDEGFAPEKQVCLQLLQIGYDEEVRTEFEKCDNDIQYVHELDRDMVDTKSIKEIEAMGGWENYNTIVRLILAPAEERLDREKINLAKATEEKKAEEKTE